VNSFAKINKVMEMKVEDPGGPVPPRAEKNTENSAVHEEQVKTVKQKGANRHQNLHERRQYDELVVKACLLERNADPVKQKF